MTTINSAYINAMLADASYVNGLSGANLASTLTARMTEAQAKFINDNFTVVTQTPDYASGFSATVW